MSRYFLGLISGTSIDGVDAVICEFGDRQCSVLAAQTFAYPPAIERRIQTLIRSGRGELAEIGAIDVAVGRFFADCAIALIKRHRLAADEIAAIGHHGQTIWHEPNSPEPFSWQLGDPNNVAAITGIDVVADLRRQDMAVGGQGAPLVPAFHEWLFRDEKQARIVLNLGGIANVTLLAPGRELLGFDTGPANTLIDGWTNRCLGQPFDDGGNWASSGNPDERLLEILLDERYFQLPAPKSTGRELFNDAWLEQKLNGIDWRIEDKDVAATLVQLSARSIADAIDTLEAPDYELLVCGGGTKNLSLLKLIGALTGRQPRTTADFGLDPDWVEAAAMAWLARARLNQQPGNVPTVTAAREARVLGGLYYGTGSRHD